MNEHQVIFSDVSLEDLLDSEGVPLEEIPIDAEYRQALLDEVNGHDGAGGGATYQCKFVRGVVWVCWVPHHEQ